MDYQQVDIPADYFFNMAKKDYYDWKEALIREFIQNSVDAQATTIDITYKDGWLTIIDDGCGMSKNTITNSLLTLGGTFKQENAVGGLGKAKEILYFSWPEWYIHSKDIEVQGKAGWFKLEKAESYFNGTLSKIKISDIFSNPEFIINKYIKKCNINADILFNGNFCSNQNEENKKKIYTIDGLGDLYECSDNSQTVNVQVNGLHMFNNYMLSDKSYVFNITQPSYDCLTSNRDGFVGEWRDKFSGMISKLNIDSESPLSSREHIIALNNKGIVLNADNNQNNKAIKNTKLLLNCLNWYRKSFPEGFFIVSEGEIKYDMIRDLYARDTLKMAKLWEVTINHVKKVNNIWLETTHGIIIKDKIEGQHRKGCLLFNPYMLYELEWDAIATKLLMLACHEITHAIGIQYHNETFLGRYDDLLFKAISDRLDIWDFLEDIKKVKKNI